MTHLTTEDFWELMHGASDNSEKDKFYEHISSCDECKLTHQSLLLVEDELKATNEVPSGFALRISTAVRRANNETVLNAPVFQLFRWTLVASVLICVTSLISLVAAAQMQWQIFLNFWSSIVPENSGYYVISIMGFVLIWFVDQGLQRFKKIQISKSNK